MTHATTTQRHTTLQKLVASIVQPPIGRDAEFSTLLHALHDLRDGRGQVIFLHGDAGVGKSYLLRQLSRYAAAYAVPYAISTCQVVEQYHPYTVWRRIFRTLLNLESDEAYGGDDLRAQQQQQMQQVRQTVLGINPDWSERLPLIGVLLGLPFADTPTTASLDPQIRQEALWSLCYDLLFVWAQQRPLLLMLEDAEWMDEASLALTIALSRLIARAPVLLVVTQPTTLVDLPISLEPVRELPYFSQLDVLPLPAPSINDLIGEWLGGSVSPLVTRLVQAQSQGNLLYAEQLVAWWRDAGYLVGPSDGAWFIADSVIAVLQAQGTIDSYPHWRMDRGVLPLDHPAFPLNFAALIQARIAHLPAAVQTTLLAASIIGRRFEWSVLRQIHPDQLDDQTLLNHLRLLKNAHLVLQERSTTAPVYLFQHTQLWSIVYARLDAAQRAQLHHATGDVLARMRPDDVEQLADHYTRGGQPQQAVDYLDQAARKAQHEYINQIALRYFGRALELERRWEWHKATIDILYLLGRRDEEEAALRAAPDFADVHPAELALGWSRYFDSLSDYEQAQDHARQALTIYRQREDRTGERLALSRLGYIARCRGDYAESRTWYTYGLRQFQGRPRSAENKFALAELQSGIGTVCRQQGDWAGALSWYMRALGLYSEIGNQWGKSKVLNSLGGIAYYQRRYAEAQRYYEQALSIQRTIGDRPREGVSLYNLSQTYQEFGDYERTKELLLTALAIQQAVGNRWEESNVWNMFGVLYHHLGDEQQTYSCLERSLVLSQAIGDASGQAYTLANLGSVQGDHGNFVQAEQTLHLGLALAQTQGDKSLISYCYSHLASINLDLSRYRQAIEQANTALRIRKEIRLELWAVTDLATLAAAYLHHGQPERARNYALQTVALLTAHQQGGLEAPQRDYFVCYKVFKALGDHASADAALQSAQHLIQRRAGQMKSDELRHSFLDRVPLNRLIMAQSLSSI